MQHLIERSLPGQSWSYILEIVSSPRGYGLNARIVNGKSSHFVVTTRSELEEKLRNSSLPMYARQCLRYDAGDLFNLIKHYGRP
jgi:hypothetical protein